MNAPANNRDETMARMREFGSSTTAITVLLQWCADDDSIKNGIALN